MMAKERPKDYPKLKNYKPSRFMLPESHYDKTKADRAVRFIENLCHTKGRRAAVGTYLQHILRCHHVGQHFQDAPLQMA